MTGHPSSLVTDNALVQRCLAGDKAAWTILLERYERLIYSVALRQGLSANRAADVFQTVAMTLLQQLEQLRDVERLAAWLVTITRRAAWQELRGGGASREDPDVLLDQYPDEYTVEATVVEWEAYQAVHTTLAHLGGRCEALLRALYLNDPVARYEEIAASLGIPVGSVGPTRARCLEKLRASMPGWESQTHFAREGAPLQAGTGAV